jgi:hypothetical protein
MSMQAYRLNSALDIFSNRILNSQCGIDEKTILSVLDKAFTKIQEYNDIHDINSLCSSYKLCILSSYRRKFISDEVYKNKLAELSDLESYIHEDVRVGDSALRLISRYQSERDNCPIEDSFISDVAPGKLYSAVKLCSGFLEYLNIPAAKAVILDNIRQTSRVSRIDDYSAVKLLDDYKVLCCALGWVNEETWNKFLESLGSIPIYSNHIISDGKIIDTDSIDITHLFDDDNL